MASMSEGPGARQLARDASGRVTTETYKDTTTTGYPKRYEYDDAGRVARVCSDSTVNVSCLPGTTGERETYDKAGNRPTATSGSTTTTGTYDAADQMVRSTTGGASIDFTYDADGNRTAAKKNGTLQRSTQWDVNASISRAATDLSATDALLSSYHYGPLGEPQSLDASTSSFYYLHDRQNSITAVRDLNNVDTYTYSQGTWGNVIGTAGGGTQQRSSFGYNDTINDPVNQSAPGGACPLCVSAGIGAAFGAVVEGGVYSWQHRNGGFTAGGFGKAVGKGALVGGLAGLLMPGTGSLAARSLGLTGGRALATSTAVNATVGAGPSYAVNGVNCRPTDPCDLLLGAAGGGNSSFIGPAFQWLRGMWAPRTVVHAYAPLRGYVIRRLRPGEVPSNGLVTPGINHEVQAWQRVVQDNDSPWISLTRDPDISYSKYGGDVNGTVAIDLSRVDSEMLDAAAHLPTHSHGYYDFAKDASFRDREILVKFKVGAETAVKHCPADTAFEQVLEDISNFSSL
ncbi:hypothetical protein ACIPW5_37795 [Streptomyces sp. NPDC090077]|uniref:hypothetical protein n=1 Tax=Streptomyces sp. NPDC090077 TaxID=3365938 RepID=UPI003804A79C